MEHAGVSVGPIHGRRGKTHLKKRLAGYNFAAVHAPWLVLMDLDSEEDCAPLLKQSLLPRPSEFMCLRIAVREVEAWLLADRESIATFLGVSRDLVPLSVEAIEDPKGTIVNLAKRSRWRAIQEDLVPAEAGGRQVGSAYTSRLGEFVAGKWRPDVAAGRCESLARTLVCIGRLIESAPG